MTQPTTDRRKPGTHLFAMALILVVAAAPADDLDAPDCEAMNGITPVCGFAAPEDIDVIPGEAVLVVGGFNLDNGNGDLRTYAPGDGTIDIIYSPDSPTPSGPTTGVYGDPACPGPPAGFAAHGIHVSRAPDGTIVLLAVNHTTRESVEWFDLARFDGRYRATWRGCVIVDEPLWINDVAMLPDGGFVASHMMPRETAPAMFDRPMNDKIETGYLVTWHRARGWNRIPGTEGALPNGIQVSADGRTIYNNHYLANQVVAFDRASGERLWTTALPGAPDNLSIAPDGRLLVTMHLFSLREIRDQCLGKSAPYCGLRFHNGYIDPVDGRFTPLLETGGPPFGGSTVAVELDGYVYMGAFAGDRIGRIVAPAGARQN